MKLFLSLILAGLLLLAGSNVFGGIYTSEMLKCSFELPSEWTTQQASPNILVINTGLGDSVEISISVFELDSDSPIRSEKALTAAIAGLYNDIGIKSATPDMIRYAVEGGTASFKAEYNKMLEETGTIIHTGLRGIVCQTVSGEQLLYLIVVMAPPEMFEIIKARTGLLMDSFQINETLAEDFFPRKNLLPYIFLLLVLALTVFFFIRNRRVQKSRNPLGKDSGSFWRCSLCGRANHIDNETCGRCGTARPTTEKITKN